MSPQEQEILTRAGAPLDAAQYIIFDQSAHLDYDWLVDFSTYYNQAHSSSQTAVKEIYPLALALMQKNKAYTYTICEMDYFRQFLTDNPGQTQAFAAVAGQLALAGGGITSPDSLLSHGEAFIRNYLVGRLWLGGTLPGLLPIRVCWVPDDFGHDPELPATLRALGITSTSFSRVPGNASGAPSPTLMTAMYQQGLDFRWMASDGSTVLAHLMPDSYAQGSGIDNSPPGVVANIQSYIDSYTSWVGTAMPNGARTPYLYVPLDNDFHAPVADLLGDLDTWNQSADGYAATGVYAIALPFADFAALVGVYDALHGVLQPVWWDGRPYWTGFYMSRPALKILHYGAARALLAAEAIGVMAQPGGALASGFQADTLAAWDALMPSTHHDYITGTAVDAVYTGEQLTELNGCAAAADGLAATAVQALAAAVQTSPQPGETPVVIANGLGLPYPGLVELASPPEGVQGIRFGNGVGAVQPSADGGLLFLADVPSAGWTTGYLTAETGTAGAALSLQGDGTYYTFTNDSLSATITQAAPYFWGISAMADAEGNAVMDTSSGPGNNIVVYQDGGDIYEFGYEYVAPKYAQYNVFNPLTPVSVTAGDAVVTENGPLRITVQVPVKLELPSQLGTFSATLEYSLVASEPFLRMSITGAAVSGTSVTVQFPFAQPVEGINNGTPCHWTSQQQQAVEGWVDPVFRPTHRFVLPRGGGLNLAAVYHPEVPAWAFQGSTLMGCVLRNTPGGPHGAAGTDDGVHTLRYALRPTLGLGDPSTAQPLSESLAYASPPVAAAAANGSAAVLPETGFVARVIGGTGVIMAAKPGDVTPGTTILRLYQPTNDEETLMIQLGAAPVSAAAVTALEDPVGIDGPAVSLDGTLLTVTMPCALATIQLSW